MRLGVVIAAIALALTGCGGGGGDGEAWGGYTESEVRDIYLSDELGRQLASLDLNPAEYQPTQDDLEKSPLIKTYFEGREVWQYRDPQKARCIYVREDPVVGEFVYQVESC